MKKTPWFPGHVKPARKGVYERKGFGGTYSEWDGKRWLLGANDVDAASDWGDWPRREDRRSFWQDHPWRGLTTKDGT